MSALPRQPFWARFRVACGPSSCVKVKCKRPARGGLGPLGGVPWFTGELRDLAWCGGRWWSAGPAGLVSGDLVVPGVRGQANTVRCSPDGTRVAAAGDRGAVIVPTDDPTNPLEIAPAADGWAFVHWHPDGSLSLAHGEEIWRLSPDGERTSTSYGEPIRIGGAHGDHVVVFLKSGVVRGGAVDLGRVLFVVVVADVVTDASGIVAMAAGGSRGDLAVWRRGSGWRELSGHTQYVADLTFDESGRFLASVGWDGQVWVWDLAAPQIRGRPLRGHSSAVMTATWTEDALYTSDGKERIGFAAKQSAVLGADEHGVPCALEHGGPRGQFDAGGDRRVEIEAEQRRLRPAH
jgi:hypothetical protein